MATFKTVVLAKRPGNGGPIIEGETFAIKEVPRVSEADLKDGQIEIQSLYLSLDPAMRMWLNDVRSYIPPVEVGAIMRGGGVGRVTKSKSQNFPVGSLVYGGIGWAEYAVLPDTYPQLAIVKVPEGGQITDALGVLGMTGMTAYHGMVNIGQVKKGDLVVVSGAAGATGSVAGQIAKIMGGTVVGLAGSDEKVAWLKELGYDFALNYKDADFSQKFKEVTKDHIDVYFDNVGGDILDLALMQAKQHARFVMCGSISQYNTEEFQGPKAFQMVVAMRIKMQGFIVFDEVANFPAFRKQLTQWLTEGKLKRRQTVLKGGLAAAPKGLIDLYKGVNTGKLLVEINSEAVAEVSKNSGLKL